MIANSDVSLLIHQETLIRFLRRLEEARFTVKSNADMKQVKEAGAPGVLILPKQTDFERC